MIYELTILYGIWRYSHFVFPVESQYEVTTFSGQWAPMFSPSQDRSKRGFWSFTIATKMKSRFVIMIESTGDFNYYDW